MLNYGIPDNNVSNIIPQTLTCDTNIYPSDIKLGFNITHERPADLIINLIGPSGKIVNVVNGIDTTFNQNLQTIVKSGVDLIYSFNSFVNEKDVLIGLPSYNSNTTNLSDLLINGSAKGDWKLVIIDSVSSKLGYLKNWNISFTGNISEEMKYGDGFLKFGYTPRYNLLDYLTSINDDPLKPYFHVDKEYLSLLKMIIRYILERI
jgi:subtilisin-like proprotein convertase family protein